MANQIAANTQANRDEAEAAEVVAAHIQRFWARPMREKICGDLGPLAAQLSPLAQQALDRVAIKDQRECT